MLQNLLCHFFYKKQDTKVGKNITFLTTNLRLFLSSPSACWRAELLRTNITVIIMEFLNSIWIIFGSFGFLFFPNFFEEFFDEFFWRIFWRIFWQFIFMNFFMNFLTNFNFSEDLFTYNLLIIASFRIGVPSILFLINLLILKKGPKKLWGIWPKKFLIFMHG